MKAERTVEFGKYVKFSKEEGMCRPMLPTAYYREFPDELLRPSRRANLFRGAGALISLARSPNALPRRRASPIPAGPDRPAFQAEPRLSL